MYFKILSKEEVFNMAGKIKGMIVYNNINTTPREIEHKAEETFGENIFIIHADNYPDRNPNDSMVIVFEK